MKIKRLLAVLISTALVVSMIPAFVFADETEAETEETQATETTETTAEETRSSESESSVTAATDSETTEPSATETEREEETIPSETDPAETTPEESSQPSEPTATTEPQTDSKKASDAEDLGGKCGAGIDWTFDASGKMTLTGQGNMYAYDSENLPPWDSFKDKIKTVIIGDGITNVGRYAFLDCKNITSVKIADTVTEIKIGAFTNCTSLESVIIPDAVTTINTTSFTGCTSLKTVKLGSGVNAIYRAFQNCTSLKSIYLPDSVTAISGAFEGCTSLESINLPKGVTIIEKNTFKGCTSLKTISIHNAVHLINTDAFKDCPNLTDVYYGGSELNWSFVTIVDGNTDLTSANIILKGSDSQYSIKVKTVSGGYLTLDRYYAAKGETVKVTVHPDNGYYFDGMKVNDDFSGSAQFTMPGEDVTIVPAFNKLVQAQVGDRKIDYHGILVYTVTNNAMNGAGTVRCDGVMMLAVPVGSEYILYDIYKTIVIPATVTLEGITYKVTSIESNAFKDFIYMKNLTIGSNVSVIGNNAFYGCTTLTSVNGGSGLKTIGANAFARCPKLSSFKIYSKCLAKIGTYAFNKDSKLKTLYIKNTSKLTKKGVKKSLKGSKVKTVKVKKSKVKKYKKYFTKKNCGRKVKVKK